MLTFPKNDWLRSEQATKREQYTLETNLQKESEKELKQFLKLCKKQLACRADAEQALAEFNKTLRLLRIEESSCIQVPIFQGKGRSKKDQKPER